MLRPRWMTLCLALIAALLLVTVTHRGSAEDPAERFVQVEDGLLDTETGLVWGYELTEVSNFITFDPETGFGNGTLYTRSFAMDMWLPCDADASSYTCTYQDWSNSYFFPLDPDLWSDDWRLPTKDEMVAAAQAGIADHLDRGPFDGFQTHYSGSKWSSTKGKAKGANGVWVVNLNTGEVKIFSEGSAISAVPVRGVAAPEPPSKPGKGVGKRNRYQRTHNVNSGKPSGFPLCF
jgi:hypothetical protein